MSNFSFTSFLEAANGTTSSRGSRYVRPHTQGQRKFYYDLCERKRIKPKDISRYTFEQLNKEIQELREMPDPASEAQINRILELTKELIALGADIKEPTDEFLRTLTGGKNGTASSLIQTLYDMRTKLNAVAPPSDEQLKIMVEWYLCPDIPFESLSTEEVMPLEYGANEPQSMTTTISVNRRVDLGNGLWRYMTPEEFAEELRTKLTKRLASKFIDKYRGVFYEWKQTRITKRQMEYIRKLEERMMNMYKPQKVEWAVVDGEYVQVTKPNSRSQYLADGYEPLPDEALVQMSREDATKFIEQLSWELEELKNGSLSTNFDENVWNDAQDYLERNRQALNTKDAKIKEFNKLNDLIYALEKIMGIDALEIHDIANEMVIEDVANKDNILRIREFFLSSITADRHKEPQKWAKEAFRLYSMCEDCQTAMKILPPVEDFLAGKY